MNRVLSYYFEEKEYLATYHAVTIGAKGYHNTKKLNILNQSIKVDDDVQRNIESFS